MSTTHHQISQKQAIDMTTRYRDNRPDHLPLSETFELSAVQRLLATTGCQYLRIYYGMNDQYEVHAILVAADANGADLLPADTTTATSLTDEDPVVLEDGYRCPQNCPPTSALNS